MPSIDNRIVNMLFENKQFEKGAEQTMKTLDELDKKLKLPDSGKAFDNITKAANSINLSGIRSGLDTIQDRFSSLGIVGMTVLQNLTNSVVNMGKKLVTAVPQQIARGGWNRAMNIEKAKFQLKGFQVAWEDISKQIDYGVKDTAYGLDAAATVASQLVASSVKFTKGLDPEIDGLDEMSRALRGISGVAAMTNSSYEDIGRIFTTVAGNGRLMGDQLLQLSGRGLNAAASLVDFFNDVNDGSIKASDSVTKSIKSITGGKKVTEAELRDLVSKGKISFKVFAEAMNTAFGDHAKAANETFNGAFDNIKAALSRIGQDFATPIIQNSVRVFNALRMMFNGVRQITKPFADSTFASSFSNLADVVSTKINSITDSINGLVSSRPFEIFKNFLSGKEVELPRILKLGDSGQDVVNLLRMLHENGFAKNIHFTRGDDYSTFNASIKDAVKEFQEANGIFASGTVNLKTWAALLGITVEELETASRMELPLLSYGNSGEQVTKLQNLLKEWKLVDWEADGIFGNKTELAVKEFQIEVGLDPTGIVDLETWAYLLETTKEDLVNDFNNEISIIDKITQNIMALVQSTKDTFSNLKSIFENIGGSIKKAWQNIFPGTVQDRIEGITGLISRFSERIKTVTQNIKDFFDPRYINYNGLEGFANSLAVDRLDKLERFFSGLFSIFSLGKQAVEGLARGFRKLIDPLSSKIAPFADTLLSGAGSFGDWLTSLNNAAQETDFFGQKFEAAADWILNAVDNIKNAFNTAKKWLTDAWSWISEKFTGIWDSIGPTVTSIWDHLKTFWENLKSFFSNITKGDKVKIQFSGFKDFLSWLGENINWDTVLDTISKVFEFVGTIVSGLLDIINSFLGGDTDGVASGIGVISNALITLAGVNIGASLAAGAASIMEFLTVLGGLANGAMANWNSAVLVNIGKGVLMLAGSLYLVSTIDSGKLLTAAGVLVGIVVALTKTYEAISGAGTSLDKFKSIFLGKLANSITGFAQSKAIVALGKAVLMLAASLWIIATIPADKMVMALIALVSLIVMLVWAFKELSAGMANLKFFQTAMLTKAGNLLRKLAVAILILSISMKIIGSMDPTSIILSLMSVVVLMVVLSKMTQELAAASNGVKAGNLAAMSLMINTMAGALLTLSLAVALLSLLSPDKLAESVVAMAAMMYMLVKSIQSLAMASQSSGSFGQILAVSLMIVILVNALLKLSIAVALMSKLDQLNMWSSVAAIIVMLYAMVGALAVLGKMAATTKEGSTGIMAMAASILILGVAMSFVAGALKKLGGMDWKQLAAGTAALIVSLYTMVGALALLNKISWNAMGGSGDLVTMAAAILVMSAAMLLLAPAIAMLGNTGWSSMIGVLAIAAALAVFIGAAALIDKFNLEDALDNLTKSVLKFGLGVALIGVGLLAAGVALTIFSGSLAAFGVAFVAFLAALLTGISTLGPSITIAVVTIIEALVNAIVMSADKILIGVGTLITTVVQALLTYAPIIMYGLGMLLLEILEFLGTMIPSVVDDLVKLLLIVINSVSIALVKNGQQIGAAIRNLVLSLGQFVWEALDGLFGPLIKVLFPNFYDQMTEVMNVGHNELLTELESENEGLRQGMAENADSMKEGWDSAISDFDPISDIKEVADNNGISDAMSIDLENMVDLESVDRAGDNVAESYTSSVSTGMESRSGTVETAANGLATTAGQVKTEFNDEGKISGRYFGYGINSGARSTGDTVYNAGVYLGTMMNRGYTDTTEEASPSKVAIRYGQYWGQGLAIGAMNMVGTVEKASHNVGNAAIDTMRDTLLRVNDILASDLSNEITIRPIVDLSNVQNGVRAIGDIFGATSVPLNSSINMPNLAHALGEEKFNNVTDSAQSNAVTNNFYVQKMDEGQIDYFVNRVNRELGARV